VRLGHVSPPGFLGNKKPTHQTVAGREVRENGLFYITAAARLLAMAMRIMH
jgi:hypothetical protein